MRTRLELQSFLEELLGSRNVYFQPPTSFKMEYPAIVYARKNIINTFADNNVYGQSRCYEITVIDHNPDSAIVDKISKLPTCKFDRHFKSDNMNHDTFTLYF